MAKVLGGDMISVMCHASGDLVSRVMNDSALAGSLLVQIPLDLASNLLTVAGVLGFMFSLNWRLTWASLLVLPLVGVTAAVFQRQYYLTGLRLQQVTGEVTAVATASVQGHREVKLFGNWRLEDARILARLTKLLTTTMDRARVTTISGGIIQLACAIGQVTVFAFGGYEVLSGRATLGQVVAFTNYLGLLYGPVQQISVANLGIRGARGAAERVVELLNIMQEPRRGLLPAPRPVRELRFDSIVFGYLPEKPVLSGCSLVARNGEITAIVGASGSGKTTLVSMVPRLLQPWSGRVLLNGVDVQDIELASLRSAVGVVSQDPFLFDGTLKDNILYGNPEATEDELARACAIARIDEIARGLPRGYDEPLGERAQRLSAGQRQRISLARVILRNPDVIILDEATSSLDSDTEAAIREAMYPLVKDKLVLVIAHRLSTIQESGTIHVLDAGRIVSSGNHTQLFESCPVYRRLYEEQFVRERGNKS